jgi:hypothetical protein
VIKAIEIDEVGGSVWLRWRNKKNMLCIVASDAKQADQTRDLPAIFFGFWFSSSGFIFSFFPFLSCFFFTFFQIEHLKYEHFLNLKFSELDYLEQ